MSEEKKPWKERQNIPDDGLIHFHDMSFDFDDYFNRYESGTMCEEEKKDFGARVMGLFCRDSFDSAKVEPWVANYLAKAMYNVLGGIPWSQALPTPLDAVLSEKENRAIEIYSNVEEGRKALLGVTNLLGKQAEKYNVSFETARADYYRIKKNIKGDDVPSW